MGDFSASWLALREPADHSARHAGLLALVGAWAAGRESLSVVDLGSGTGSTLRRCALELPPATQCWTLVDSDERLLVAARERLGAWSERSQPLDDGVRLLKGGKSIDVRFRRESLGSGLACVRDVEVDLVTASALFDLVSASWIDALVAALAARRLPLYAALTYDGREEWAPAHLYDGAVHRAFLAHQHRDKGFGLAVGPDGTALLSSALARQGYAVEQADSVWRLQRDDAELIEQLADGIAAAAAIDAGPEVASQWGTFRRENANSPNCRVVIGHRDLWARLAPS